MNSPKIHTINFYFSICDYARTIMDDGASYRTQVTEESNSWGWIFISGQTEIINSTNPNIVGALSGETIWVKNTGQFIGTNIWKSNGATEWVCLSKSYTNPNANLDFQCLEISSQTTLPAGMAFFVLQGTVLASDGPTVNQDNYYKPRNQDIILTGTAKILLVKFL